MRSTKHNKRTMSGMLAGLCGASLIIASACGTIVGNPKKPQTPGDGTTNTVIASPVNDPSAQKQSVLLQLDAVVNALSDGGSGSNGGGIGAGIGLLDRLSQNNVTDAAFVASLESADTFAEARSCKVSALEVPVSFTDDSGLTWEVPAGAQILTMSRKLSGHHGSLSYANKADSTPSGTTEIWYPGPYFGLANVTPAEAKAIWGDVTPPISGTALTGIPVGKPAVKPTAGSSGALGSVGWRSADGSWTGAPVWQAGPSYQGTASGALLSASSTQGMVMYLSGKLPDYTCTSSSVGTCVAGGVPMSLVSSGRASSFSVLGFSSGGGLPSFTSSGEETLGGKEVAVVAAGKVTVPGIPARMYNPPTDLACDGSTNISPGWRFAQNVAGLTRVATTDVATSHSWSKGTTETAASGTITTTWSDPALVAPVVAVGSGSGGGAYFDENAGTVTLTRRITIGSTASPHKIISTFSPTGKAANAKLTVTQYSSQPVVDIITRDLLDSSWEWTQRTIASGQIVSTHQIAGATIGTVTTTFDHAVFKHNADKNRSCVPTAGTISTTIAPADTAKQTTTIVLKFGATAQGAPESGVTATVTCSGGAAGAKECTAQPETEDADYQPTGCNF